MTPSIGGLDGNGDSRVSRTPNHINQTVLMRITPMAIKPKMANSPVIDDLGYAHGELADITETTYVDPKSGDESDQFQFDFIVEGKIKPINMKFWTGVRISSEKQDFSRSKSGDYSKLTRLCLALGLIEKDGLDDPDSIEALADSLVECKGKQVKFKLAKSDSKSLSTIDLDTIQLVD